MEKYKIEILTVEEFLENRPNLYTHSQNEIQSAIYQSASLLNGETAGLVQKVWDYVTSPSPDTNNELYRNSLELSFLKEAFIVQTQFALNNANSFVQGSNSFNATGFNLSSTSPVERDVLAPNVRTLLQQANMYVFQTLGSLNTKSDKKCLVSDMENPLTLNQANQLYVTQIQEKAQSGQVAVIDLDKPTKQVVFKNLGEVLENTPLKATTVKDKDNDFRELKNTQVVSDLTTGIQNVLDISNSKDNEINEKINEINAKLEDSIIFKNRGAYQSGETYKLLDVVTYNNKVYFCKVETTTNPPTNKTDWDVLTPEVIDLSPYATREWVNQQLAAYDTSAVADTKYVNLTQEQNIIGKKNFVNNFVTQKIVGDTGWYELRKSDNTRLGLLGRASVTNNKFTVWSDLENLYLRAPIGKNIEIDVQNNVHSEKTPTNENHLTNKRYVDSRDNALNTRITNLENNVVTVSNWSNSVTYRLGQQVYFNNEFYISTQDNNTNHQPDTSPDYWKLLTAQGGGTVDLSGYYTKPEADAKFATNTQLQDYLTITNAENTYVKNVDISNYATQEWVANQNYATQSELNSYVLTNTLTTNYWDKTQLANKYVSLDTNQTITGTKTFNNVILFGNDNALKTNREQFNITIESQGQKRNFYNYIQPNTGFRNYCDIINARIKHGSSAQWQELFLLQSRNTNEGIFIRAESNKISFLEPTTIINALVPNPTSSGEIANKQYVDNAITPVSTKANTNGTNITNLTNRVTTLESRSSVILYKKVIDWSSAGQWTVHSWNNNRTTLTAKLNLTTFLNQNQINNLVNVIFKSTNIPSGTNESNISISHYISGNELVFKLQTNPAANNTNIVFRGVITLIFASEITTV